PHLPARGGSRCDLRRCPGPVAREDLGGGSALRPARRLDARGEGTRRLRSGRSVKLRADAPAKINRELKVGRIRPDGFHEIRSRLVAIDLADSIEVETGTGSLQLFCTGLPVPGDESNLVARAARALAARLRRPTADATIRLEKKIPVGAGLGGGSSDAARALVLLAELWGSRLSFEDLGALAASLGSDVPFFLVGGEADVTGRGEKVRPLPDSPP